MTFFLFLYFKVLELRDYIKLNYTWRKRDMEREKREDANFKMLI